MSRPPFFDTVRVNSVAAFRGEVERALALNAEFLVLHPGSWKGLTREEGLRLAAQSIERAVDGVQLQRLGAMNALAGQIAHELRGILVRVDDDARRHLFPQNVQPAM